MEINNHAEDETVASDEEAAVMEQTQKNVKMEEVVQEGHGPFKSSSVAPEVQEHKGTESIKCDAPSSMGGDRRETAQIGQDDGGDDEDEAKPLIPPSVWPPFAVEDDSNFVRCFAHVIYMVPAVGLVVFGIVQVIRAYVESREPKLVSSFEKTEFKFPTVTICPSAYRDPDNALEFTQDDIGSKIKCNFTDFSYENELEECKTELITQDFNVEGCVEFSDIGSSPPCVLFNAQRSQETDLEGWYSMQMQILTERLAIRDYSVSLFAGDPRMYDPETCTFNQIQFPPDGFMMVEISNMRLEKLNSKVEEYYGLISGPVLPFAEGTPQERGYQVLEINLEPSEYAVHHLKQQPLNIFLVLGSVAGLFAYVGLGFKLFFTDTAFIQPKFQLCQSCRSFVETLKRICCG